MIIEPFDVFVLAAGKGERLRPLTLTTPKPLLPLHGKPLLDWVIDPLKDFPVRRLIINAWYLKEQIVSYVESLQGRYPFPVLVSVESDLLGTAGGLKQALRSIDASRVLMLNGDCFWRGDLTHFIQGAEAATTTEGTWWLTDPQPDQTLIGYRDRQITSIGDLWKQGVAEAQACFSGIQWFRTIDLNQLPDRGCIVRDYWIPRLKQNTKLGALSGGLKEWSDIGNPERYRQLCQKRLSI